MYSALQLFELHATRIRPDIKLTGKEREAAIRICQRVDGMPLAIELAAAWVNVLSCEEIADEIDAGLIFSPPHCGMSLKDIEVCGLPSNIHGSNSPNRSNPL